MSRQLAAHNSNCNGIYSEYQECEKQYPVCKYLGYCDELYKKLTGCIKEERIIRQKKNLEISKNKFQRRHSEDSAEKEK